MIELMSIGWKDDIESLMYILCYLYTGVLPIIEFIKTNIENFEM